MPSRPDVAGTGERGRVSTIGDRGAAFGELARTAGPAGFLRGRVVSVHRRAVYLRFGDVLVAHVGTGVDAGPLHLRGPVLPPARPGEAVRCDGARIEARHWAVRCDVPDRIGVLPGPGELARARHRGAPAGAGVPAEAGAATGAVALAVRDGDLAGAADLLGGRGPGLTPAGDDVLAGLLLVARALWGPAAEPWLTGTAGRVPTTGHARAFLHWAARGQGLAPEHAWLAAVVSGRPGERLRLEHRLAGIGASSGRCLVAGLRLGLAQLPVSPVETQVSTAAAGPGL